MTPNELLLWLSARKEGSWLQFRSAIETLDLAGDADGTEEDAWLPLHQRIRYNFARLGHVEFDADACEDGWRVVPPTLAISEDGNKTVGILCGARSLKLLERIERAGATMTLERTLHADCPDVIRMQAEAPEVLKAFAREAGLRCQADAPAALLSRLPGIGSLKGWKRESLPAGGKDWDVKRFIVEKKQMKWRSITVQEANAPSAHGLFRFTRFQTPQYFFREGRDTVTLPGAVGKYYILFRRERRVLRYDKKQQSLSVPAIFRPPLLTERGLILCSGFPPALSVMKGRPTLTYQDVPEEIAGMTAEILRQDLV